MFIIIFSFYETISVRIYKIGLVARLNFRETARRQTGYDMLENGIVSRMSTEISTSRPKMRGGGVWRWGRVWWGDSRLYLTIDGALPWRSSRSLYYDKRYKIFNHFETLICVLYYTNRVDVSRRNINGYERTMYACARGISKDHGKHLRIRENG